MCIHMNAFDKITYSLLTTFASLPDKRSGANVQYSMQDIALTAFSVFFMQSPSFLSAQEDLQKRTGKNNLKTLFRVDRIPSDNHVRMMLDPIKPDALHPVFDCIYEALGKQGILKSMRGVGDTQYIALDGTQIHSSNTIQCVNCSTREHKNGTVSYHHNAVTPVIVAPHRNLAIPLRVEFLSPQDGHDKQDSEPAAAKRWLNKNGEFYNTGNVTLLGDDLYSRQPFCRKALLYNFHFIFVCKPTSHPTLYDWIDLLAKGAGVPSKTTRQKNKKGKWETHTVRYANNVPLIDGEGVLHVNWIEHIVTCQGKETYKNAFVTDHEINEKNAMGIAEGGRCRWKIENENNNTLKTKGYHLEHNFGHGKENLCSVLAALNILAFLTHTFLDTNDRAYQLIRLELRSRRKFFEHVRVLTCYQTYPGWDDLMEFMIRGLEIEYDSG